MGVLRHVEGMESALLRSLRCLSRRDPTIAREQDDAVTHGTRLERVSVHAKIARSKPEEMVPAVPDVFRLHGALAVRRHRHIPLADALVDRVLAVPRHATQGRSRPGEREPSGRTC